MNKIFDLIEKENKRQQNEVCLIASENYVSENVLKAQGSILTNKYAEGYPSRRYYGGCEIVDEVEQYAIDKACELFKCEYANVQPHSGSQANQAVYNALLQPGDTILSMSLDAGGHLTHGAKVSSSGKNYNIVHYGLDENGYIDYDDIKHKLEEHNPKLLVVGASAYSRKIDFEKIRKIVDEHNIASGKSTVSFSDNMNLLPESFTNRKYEIGFDSCFLMVDMAHIAGLVAAELHQSPLPYADVVTSTTHKTLRGPRGGIILSNDEIISKKINSSVFPGIQGGPLLHIIAAKAVCFEEALQPSFKEYQEQVIKNMKAMEETFRKYDIDMISDGSDNHLLLLDLRKYNISGKELEDKLSEQGIIVNKNAIVNDPLPKTQTSGIRIGTPAVTTRGYKEEDCVELALKIIENIK